MALAELTVAQGQVTVALDALLEDQDVPGTVHRLEGELALFALGGEHVVAVFVPMSGFLPQGLVDHLRAFDLLVAVVLVDAAHVLLHALPKRPSFGVPKHQTRRVVVDVKQVQLAPKLAVVAFFGLLQQRQMLLQFILGRPGGAVDALQHLVAVVAPPVGTGHLHQLEMLESTGAGHVRAAAEVLKKAFTVERNILASRDRADDFGLVVLAHGFEIGHRLIARQHTAHNRLVLGRQLSHPLFDGLQVFGREGALVRKIVIKPVLDHRADGHLRLREQLFDRIGQQVGRGVTDHLQALGVLGRDDRQFGIAPNGVGGVHELAIDLAAQGRLGQAGSDRGGHFGHRHRLGKLTQGTVGKSDLDHGCKKLRRKQKSAASRAF